MNPLSRFPAREWLLRNPNGQEFPFRLETGQSVTIGRDLTSDIPVLDAGVSRHHATLSLDVDGEGQESLWLEDLHSQNGTFVNTERIRRTQVFPGDVITIGRIPLTLAEHPVGEAGGSDPLLRLSSERLSLLLRVTHDFAAEPEKPLIFQRLLEVALEALEGDRGAVLLWEEERTVFFPVAASPRTAFGNLGALLETRLGETVLRGGKARLLWPVTSAKTGLELVRSTRAPVCSAVAIPLLAGAREIGILYLDRTSPPRGFELTDLDFLQALAWVADTALGTSCQLADMRDWNERLESLLTEKAIPLDRVSTKPAPQVTEVEVAGLLRRLESSLSETLTETSGERSLSRAAHGSRTKLLEGALRAGSLHAAAMRRLYERKSARLEEVQLALALQAAVDRRQDLGEHPVKVEQTCAVVCSPDELDMALDLALDAVLCGQDGPALKPSILRCEVESPPDSTDVVLRLRGGKPSEATSARRSLSLSLLERFVKERLHGRVASTGGRGSTLEIRMPPASLVLEDTAGFPVIDRSSETALLSSDTIPANRLQERGS